MTMVCAVWEPGRALQFRSMPWNEVEALAGGPYPALARAALWRDGKASRLLKLLCSDVSALFPEQFGAHDEAATVFVAALGGPVQPWRGALVVYGIDSVEGGFPWTLSDRQRGWISAAYRDATGREPEDQV